MYWSIYSFTSALPIQLHSCKTVNQLIYLLTYLLILSWTSLSRHSAIDTDLHKFGRQVYIRYWWHGCQPGTGNHMRSAIPSPGWGPRGRAPAKIVRAPAKITGLFMLKNRKKTRWQPCVVCSMEAGADGWVHGVLYVYRTPCWVTLTLIPVVTRLTA